MIIDVTVQHSLGIEQASARLKKSEGAKLPDGVTLLDEKWSEVNHRAELNVQVAGHAVNVVVAVTSSSVRFTTSELPWYFAPFAWAAKQKIKQKLQEVLK